MEIGCVAAQGSLNWTGVVKGRDLRQQLMTVRKPQGSFGAGGTIGRWPGLEAPHPPSAQLASPPESALIRANHTVEASLPMCMLAARPDGSRPTYQATTPTTYESFRRRPGRFLCSGAGDSALIIICISSLPL